MAQLNVFELTNSELSKSLKESKKKTKRHGKRMNESVKFGRKFRNVKSISANRLRVESLRYVEDANENDEIVDYTPDEDVVLVIDPEMDETPATEEEAEAAAEELIGDYVCKCAICGANYICDCEDIGEDLETEEGECPICGETGEQIIVGEITPAEDVESEEDEEEADDEEDVDDEEEFEDETDDIEDEESDIEDEEDEDFGESINRVRRKSALRRESAMRNRKCSSGRSRTVAYNLDESKLNRMLTKFAKENYDNVKMVKIVNGTCKGTRLTLEGTVITTKGTRRSTKFVCENFRPLAYSQAKFREIGTFTENATSNKKDAFTISFVTKNNVITPTALKYNYNVKEGRSHYNVCGSVVNESVHNTPVARKRRRR